MNYGIWNAAAGPWKVLQEKYGIQSEIWYPGHPENSHLPEGLTGVPLTSTKLSAINGILKERKAEPDKCYVMTHGAWQFPTRWGHALAGKGFAWCYVPHGMLEPWSMSQKRIKKHIYFRFVEKKMTGLCELVRAVGSPEMDNLIKVYGKRVVLVPNGIPEINFKTDKKPGNITRYLFLSRLHHKKGIIPLVKAWIGSSLSGRNDCELVIVGPDDGELAELQNLLGRQGSSNIHYEGAVYGRKKEELLGSAGFFILPSQSEGFPTSVLEAMQYGAIPLISTGCNFPEALKQGVAFPCGTKEEEIQSALENSLSFSDEKAAVLRESMADFVHAGYSMEVIARKIFELISNSRFD